MKHQEIYNNMNSLEKWMFEFDKKEIEILDKERSKKPVKNTGGDPQYGIYKSGYIGARR